jgi:hypothetical protein
MDKARESAIATQVLRGLRHVLPQQGFDAETSRSFILTVDGYACVVWLQKFRRQAAFRVAMTFRPAGEPGGGVTEFADRYTYKDSPSGRKYRFHFLRSNDAAEVCIREVEAFVREVAAPWFQDRIAEVKQRG